MGSKCTGTGSAVLLRAFFRFFLDDRLARNLAVNFPEVFGVVRPETFSWR